MKILLLSQWFEPEPFFKGLVFAKELTEQGHQVDVLTGFPNYPGGEVYTGYTIRPYKKEIMEGITVHRVALYPDHGRSAIKRILNYISFGLSAFLCGAFKLQKFDVIYAYHPPLTTGIAAAAVSFIKRTPFVLDVQDLWPDTLAATGMLQNKKILKIVAWFCSLVYKKAAHIVVLSSGFKERLIDRGVPTSKITIIHNWCDEVALLSGSKSRYTLPKKGFNVVFAGNLGHAQGLPTLIAAAKLLLVKGVMANIVIVGDGVAKNEAVKIAKQGSCENVYFLPRIPTDEVGSLLSMADVLLVHLLDDELFKITIPSKTQAYLLLGKPVIMAVDGDARRLIEEAKAGIYCNPGDSESLASAIIAMVYCEKEELKNMGDRGATFYNDKLSKAVGVKKFIDVFENIIP